jgi:hypothetical protein
MAGAWAAKRPQPPKGQRGKSLSASSRGGKYGRGEKFGAVPTKGQRADRQEQLREVAARPTQ